MSDEGFLSRWSRRKRAAESGQPAPEPAPVPAAVPRPPGPAPTVPEEPGFDLASLPPVESLTAESDFAAFLRKEVPEALKRAALRKAWALDPAIRDFVGPADYAWDFNAPDGVPGFAPDLGGDVKRLLAQAIGFERDEEAAEAARAAAAAVTEAREEVVLASPEPEPEPATAVVREEPGSGVAATAEAASPPAPRRHGSALPS